jgi:hypothetical protein
MSILVSKKITYGAWFDAIGKAGRTLDTDPRLVALVQFLARRAAEEDFAAALEKDKVEEISDEGD